MKDSPRHFSLALILVVVAGCGDSQQKTTPPTGQSSDSVATGNTATSSVSPDNGTASSAVPDAETSSLAALPSGQLDALIQRFNQGVGLMDRYQPAEAVAAFAEVVRKAPHWTTGRLNLGIALLNLQQEEAYERAERELKRVIAAEPDNVHAHFSLGMLLIYLARFDEARPHFEQVLKVDPNDADAHYQLAVLLEEDDKGAARQHYETALKIMPHFESACYRLQRLLRMAGETEQAGQLLARFQTLKASGSGVTSGMKYSEMGRYANVIHAFEDRPSITENETVPVFQDVAEQVGLTEPSGGRAGWPGEDAEITSLGPGVAVADIDLDGDLDLFIPGGFHPDAESEDRSTLYRNDDGQFSRIADSGLVGTNAIGAFFGDYDADGAPDLFLTCNGPNRLYRNDGQGAFTDVTESCGVAGGPWLSTAAAWVDADHDGDLDLIVANYAAASPEPDQAAGAPNTLWQNNGDGTFTNASTAAQFDHERGPTMGILALDVDGDRDQDLFLINHHAVNRLYRNDRAGQYTDATSHYPRLAGTNGNPKAGGLGAVLGDVDANGLEDLLLLHGRQPPTLLLQHSRGQFEVDPAFAVRVGELGGAVGASLGDFDLDGDLDLVLLGVGSNGHVAHQLLLNRGDGNFSTTIEWNTPGPNSSAREPSTQGAVAADLDGDGMLELLVARAGRRPQLWRAAAPSGSHWLELIPRLAGEGNEQRIDPTAIGMQAELKTGIRGQVARVSTSAGYLGSPPPRLHFGMGPHGQADYVRLTWPDGVLQSELEVVADQPWHVAKVERKPSSCPVLFSWDGHRFAYVTDCLGGGGLGFWVGPGKYAPPDPTEAVRIPPEQIQTHDGNYLLRLAEPLEEVSYVDQLALVVYDHPADWELYPDERFATTGPPPTGRPHAVRKRIFPVAAHDDRGNDCRPPLLKVDRQYVEPPANPRFTGYARDHWLELDFGDQLRQLDPDASLVLYLHGWVEYTFSHVNYAAAQAGLVLRGPSIEVPTDQEDWQTVMADAGYPAGLPRMTTRDVSELPIRSQGRLRIRTNMEIFWDQAFLAVDVAPGPITAHRLTPTRATLRPFGFPREYSPDGNLPTRYDYHRLEPGIAFKNMLGDYTRYGDIRPLLREVDDRFAILGRGDEITLEFSADPLPALPEGWSRTFVLDCDGYCKDMDLYTARPDTVEPLPFHGMQNYPPDDPTRDDASYRQYRSTWNTRRVSGR